MGTKRWTIPATAALLLLSACSCTGNDDTPTPTTQSQEPQVEAAYLAYREMVTRLLEAPNPDDPELALRASGENLAFLVETLRSLQEAGTALRFAPAHQFSIESIEIHGSRATVRDCTVDAAQTINVTTGEVVSEGTTTELLEATLVFETTWKTQTIDRVQQWEGITTCAGP